MKWLIPMALLVAVFPCAGLAQDTVEAGPDGRQTLTPVQQPRTGFAVEAGTDEQRLTGRLAFTRGKSTFDVALTGADKDSGSGRSTLVDLLTPSSGGTLSLGYTWSDFSVHQFKAPLEKLKELCKAWKLTEDYRQTDADRVQKALSESEEYKRLELQASHLREALKSAEASLQPALSALYEATLAALAAERELITSRVGKPPCGTEKDLPPYAQKELPTHSGTRLLLSARLAVSAQSTEYFVPDLNETKEELKYPWSIAGGIGWFISGKDLVGLTVGLNQKREAEDPQSVCSPPPSSSPPSSYPVYTCEELSVGTPTWENTAVARLELRSIMVGRVALNPSVALSLDSKRDLTFGDAGAVTLEVPVYLFLQDEQTHSLTLGLSLKHTQSWEPNAGRTVDQSFAIFLGGAFGRLSPALNF